MDYKAKYSSGFYLTGLRGNNAFSYKERAAQLGGEPRIFVPAIADGGLMDLEVGDETAFEDFDEHGKLRSCKGLKRFVRTELFGVPTVIFDNHNHAFYFWWEAAKLGLIKRGATLLHVDQHKDMRGPAEHIKESSDECDELDMDEVFRYTNEVLNVGNYILPSLECRLIGEVRFVTSEAELESVEPASQILNLDMDFFAPEMSYVPFEKVRGFIREAASKADFITIATSPFFMDQRDAIELLNKLFG